MSTTTSVEMPPDTISETCYAVIKLGIWRSGPQAIGIGLCGIPLLALAAIGYFLLGSVPVEVLSGASGLGVGGMAIAKARGTDRGSPGSD